MNMGDPLSVIASVVGVLSFGISSCKGLLEFYQSVRSSRNDIQALCESTETLHKIMNEIIEIVDRHNLDSNAIKTIRASVDACRAGLVRLASRVEKLQKNANNRGLRNLPSALQYPFKQSTIAKLKEVVVHELMGNLGLAISVLNLDMSDLYHQTYLDGFSATNANIDLLREETRGGLDRISALARPAATQPDDLREIIIKWISQSDFTTDYHRSACEQREPHTGNWFIKGSRYKEWRDTPGSFLWLHGIPGCGKTILCSTIIEETISYCSCRDSYFVAYYYFTFSNSEKQKTNTLLRSLLLQLFRQQLSIPGALLDVYTRYKHEDPPECGLIAALRSIIEKMGETYIIIDALDECPSNRGERAKLIAMLDRFKEFNLLNLHILTTSRKEPDLDGLAQMVSSSPVNIQSSEVDKDIQLHVQNQLSTNPKLSRWPLIIREEIETTLVRGASGMFRWVSCQLDSLRTCLRPSTVRQTLQSLPKTLDDTYDRILLNIKKEHSQEALSALTWLLFSNEPLRIEEIAEAIVIDVSATPSFDPNERLFDPESVLTVLSSLVSVTKTNEARFDPVSGNFDEEGTAGRIHLAHFSVKEYLTSTRVTSGPASRFHIEASTANQLILDSCLCYIDYSRSSMGTRSQLQKKLPLIKYACNNWPVHAKKCEGLMTEMTQQSIVKFLNSEENMNRWTFFFQPEENRPHQFYTIPLDDKFQIPEYRSSYLKYQIQDESRRNLTSPLYYAACVELNDIVDAMLVAGANANGQGRLYENALLMASLKGYSYIVRRLLKYGAYVNGRGETALQAACFGGHAEIVGQLIEAGADVNLRATYFSSLEAAADAINPNPQVVLQLLENDVMFDHKQPSGSRLMRWAAIEGHEAVVRLLLTKLVAELGSTTSYNWTLIGYDTSKEGNRSYRRKVSAPYEAVFHRHEGIVRLFLEGWDNLEEQDDENRTALYWACFQGSEGIVRMLLNKGADIHSVGPNGWTARYWATWRNDEVMLELLNMVCGPDHCSECASAEMKAIMDIQAIASYIPQS